MILKIKSENPYLLDILHKNPTTDFGLYAKNLKNGVVIGNCVSPNAYEITFQDSKYSYLPEDSNAIDFQSYVSPLVVLHISNDFLGTLLKPRTEYLASSMKWLDKSYQELDNQSCTIEVLSFYINSSWVKGNEFLLSRYFPNVSVQHKVGRNYHLTIEGKTVFEAVNLLNLISVFVHITNNYGPFTFIDDSFAEKYTRLLTNLENVPYFVFYLFIKKAIKTPKQFEKLKPKLEDYFIQQGIEAKFSYGFNHQERVNYIADKLSLDNEILDVGCGEFIYFRKLVKMGYEKTYYAIDEDSKFEALSEQVQQKLNVDNLRFFNSLEAFDTSYKGQKLDILLTEVIEHNSEDEAKSVIDKLLKYNFNQIIITTPNKDFNKYYFEDEESKRHDDHDFEMTGNEFHQFMNQFQNDLLELEFDQIGDSLDNVSPTQVCILTKKEQYD